jgi:hypothetical protein
MRTYFGFNVRRFAELTRLDLNSLLKDLREITGRSEILAYGIPLEELLYGFSFRMYWNRESFGRVGHFPRQL